MSGRILALVLFHIVLYGAVALIAPTPGWQQTPALYLGVVLAVGLIALSVIDFETLTLPHPLTLTLLACGLLAAWMQDDALFTERVLAATGAFLFFHLIAYLYVLIRKRHGLGGGDSVLFGVAGAWVGPAGLPPVLLLATTGALAAVLISYILNKQPNAQTRYAFGPFLAFGLWVQWLLSQT